MSSRRVLTLLVMVGCCAAVAWAQQVPPQPPVAQPPAAGADAGGRPSLPVTPLDPSKLSEEERERLGEFMEGQIPSGWSYGELIGRLMEPIAVPKAQLIPLGDGLYAPHKAIPWKMVIVKEEGETAWVQQLPPEDPRSSVHKLWIMAQQRELAELEFDRRAETEKAFFVDFSTEPVPPPSVESLRFEKVTSELPGKGRWQMNFDLEDMNGDGVVDIVLPPERLGAALPAIFLGQGGGRFAYWKDAYYTTTVPYDYGGIAATDLDGDGDKDLVLGIHFKGQYVIYNQGKGQFSKATQLPSPEERVSSRAVTVGDFDGDGRTDVAFLAELTYDYRQSQLLPEAPSAWVVLNRGEDRWEVSAEGMPKQLLGDRVAAADLDGDTRLDLVLSSGKTGWRSLAWLNTTEGWKESYGTGVLSSAWHGEVVVDPSPAAGKTQLFASFEQFKMVGGKNTVRTGLIAYRWGEGGLAEPGVPVVVSSDMTNQYSRVAVGDLNGDGLTDLVTGRRGGGLEAFVQGPAGVFSLERGGDLAGVGRAYGIRLVDLDGDGKDDIVASYSPRGDTLPGGVHVWLTRPTVAPTP